MEKYDPKLAGSSVSIIESSAKLQDDPDYDKQGFSYGSGTIPATQKRPRPKVEYITPSAKDLLRDLEGPYGQGKATNGKSTDKKRKRHNVEDLNLSVTQQRSHDSDADMADAPPAPSFSTGLTGGLNRLLSKSDKSKRSDDYDMNDPPSPITRSRPSSTYVTEKDQSGARRDVPTSSALVRVKSERRSSSEDRPRKHHRSHRSDAPSTSYHEDSHKRDDRSHRDSLSEHTSHKHSRPRSQSRSTALIGSAIGAAGALKALDNKPYRHTSLSDISSRETSLQPRSTRSTAQSQGGAIVLYQTRAELFTSFVTKGPDSEGGCSINKALKRYHRERAALMGREGQHTAKEDKLGEEGELWKEVRLKKNDRGEIVLFF